MATGLLFSGLIISPAYGGPTGAFAAINSDTPEAATAATNLVEKLGARTGGSYLDANSGRMVVTVTDMAAAQTVRAAGAVPKVVSRGGAKLAAATAELESTASVPGTAWAVDPTTNKVVVSIDSSVTGDQLTKVTSAAARLGDAVRVEKVDGLFDTFISGGDAIFTGSSRCSLGFNVRSGNTYSFLTAGHCTNGGTTWYANASRSTVLGTRAGTSFPGNDYGIVRYTNASIAKDGSVAGQDIARAGTPAINQTVTRRGSTTGTRTGRVTALNATVNYPQGSVSGLIRTTVCAEPGDSGGAMYAGNTAYGLTSGGSGNCRTGGTTFFQPVTEVLSRYGVSVF